MIGLVCESTPRAAQRGFEESFGSLEQLQAGDYCGDRYHSRCQEVKGKMGNLRVLRKGRHLMLRYHHLSKQLIATFNMKAKYMGGEGN